MTTQTTFPLLDRAAEERIALWLEEDFDEETKKAILHLLESDPKSLSDAFYTHLTFGTAGLRGIVGLGSNRINPFTIRAATQGLAYYITKTRHRSKSTLAVVIGYDCRPSSRLLAEETAKVFAGNGIVVYLFDELRPSPLVSFACKELGCTTGVVITASHNPPEYNGYKVYWSDGSQIVSPHDRGISVEIRSIQTPKQVKQVESLDSPFIRLLGLEMDEDYIRSTLPLQLYPDTNHSQGWVLSIAYTSLHGTGITLIPDLLRTWGFTKISLVESQIVPDGLFPTVKLPNPEDPEAMQLGIQHMLEERCDLLLATDPDADRVGAVVMHEGKAIRLNGHQIACLCLEHILNAMSSQGCLPPKAAFIKTISTSELFMAICKRYNRPCFEVLTGFKHISALIREWEQADDGYQFIFGAEESYGYLLGTETRDKDGVLASALICEVALQAKLQNKTLVDLLYDLYRREGIFQESSLSLIFDESQEGKRQMAIKMHSFRNQLPREIMGKKVVKVDDYLTASRLNVQTMHKEAIALPHTDTLRFWLEDGSKLTIRPSGTEPKIKLACSVVQKEFANIEAGIASSLEQCRLLLEYLQDA